MSGHGIPLLLLSDVDGTLIGDNGEIPAPAADLRRRLAHVAAAWGGTVHVGLASSRTLRELTVLQRALRLPGPCIAEDGARYAIDEQGPGEAGYARLGDAEVGRTALGSTEQHGRRQLRCWALATPAAALRAEFKDVPSLAAADTRRQTAEGLRTLGFRSRGAIRRALDGRTHSILLDPTAWTAAEQTALRAMADGRGWHLRRGGRWWTLTTTCGKGPAVEALRAHFTTPGHVPVVAAIGNEENDQSLLAAADVRFVIRNPHRGPHPALRTLFAAQLLEAEGHAGWLEMLDRLVPLATVIRQTRSPEAYR